MYIEHTGQGGKVQLTHEQFDEYLNENCVRINDQWVCCICDYARPDKQGITRHIECRHVTLPATYCQICNKPLKNSRGIAYHMRKYHSHSQTE